MCVAWERRGSGLGKAMLAALLRFADTNGIGEIRLTVDEPNVSARKLYEKTGFVIEKTVNKVAYYRRKEPSQETVANEKM
jgi:ribosomal protein S18 acetylase RimI-like enzyme